MRGHHAPSGPPVQQFGDMTARAGKWSSLHGARLSACALARNSVRLPLCGCCYAFSSPELSGSAGLGLSVSGPRALHRSWATGSYWQLLMAGWLRLSS